MRVGYQVKKRQKNTQTPSTMHYANDIVTTLHKTNYLRYRPLVALRLGGFHIEVTVQNPFTTISSNLKTCT